MKSTVLIHQFQFAKSNPKLTIIEGVQALKHAVRFEADVETIITCDLSMLEKLVGELAPDVAEQILDKAQVVAIETFDQLSSRPIRTKTISLAKKRSYKLEDLEKDKPIVVLEDPKDLDNVGAVVRVASAADAAAVIAIGNIDIWHPLAIRGGAGLQYATPVFSFRQFDASSLRRPLIAMDPTGENIQSAETPQNAIYIFGTERHGITQETLNSADQKIRLPMKKGVSSINLATSVAATLYSV